LPVARRPWYTGPALTPGRDPVADGSRALTAIAGLRSELVCWMFGFWVSTLLGIAGLLIALRGP
jgi:hypothetical protein